MFILERLPSEFYTFCSTVALTTEQAAFTVDTITTKILAEVSMLGSRRSLKSRVSNVETDEVGNHSAHRTSVIRKGPPNFNKWRPQGGFQQGSSNPPSGRFGQNRPNFQKRPQGFQKKKEQNRSGFQMRNANKGKGKGKAPQQSGVNQIEGEQGFIHEVLINDDTDETLNEASEMHYFDHNTPLGASESLLMEVDLADLDGVSFDTWETGTEDAQTGMDEIHPHSSFRRRSSFTL